MSLPGAEDTYISIPRGEGQPYVRGRFYSGEDGAAAEKAYDSLVVRVKPAL